MPIEYVRDPRTGKLVAKGSLGFGQAVVPEAPPRPRQPAKPKSKPRSPGIFGFGANGFSLDKLGNDLRYELNQLRSDPVRSAQRVIGTRPEAQIALGGATALSNAARAVIEYKQKAGGRSKADYTTSPVARAVDAYEDTVFRALNQTPPSQMTGQEKAIRDMRGSVTLAVATSLGGGALLNAARGVRFIGPAAQALSNITNPGNATTAIGAVGRVAADAVVGELASTPLDDNTGGSAAGLVDMVLGTKLDPVKPGMDRPEAAAAAFGPNALAGFAIAAPLAGLGRWAGHARARSAQRAAQPVQQARAELEAAGLTQSEPESGASAFTPEAAQGTAGREYFDSLVEKYGVRPAEPAATPEPAPQPATAPTQAMEPGGAVTPGKLPSADPAIDPWEIDYDPSLPEADVALTLVKNASDDELLNALRGDGAVLDQLDQSIASRPPVEPDPALSTDVNGAPSASLAPPITPFADQWKRLGQKDPNALLAVLHPDVNPALAERAQAMFGRGWEGLTPQDAIDTLQAAAADGMTVMPNRLLPDQRIMLTGDIKRDPARFQYKGGTDARGVQRGSSLEGVDRWNSDMEGAVEVWQDPKDGNYYVVNGHNRLAKAQELGINSLLVREIIADSPEQAKTAGALSNIASGGGTPLDAAWFMKGAGIAEPQQLESMGVPLSPTSGHGLSGFQLSRLPDDILRAVESGQIKERMGRIVGGSGADEESMRAAYRYLVDNPGTTEGRLRGMLELSKQMGGQPQIGAAAEQTDLLKGTTWDQTFNKQMIAVADLADEVSTLLKREKRLFTMADANSAALEAKGSRIDKASAQQVADANARAIDFFQRTWMETGPIRDLLNEGGARVAAGENKGAVAKQIKNRLVGQLGDLMGEEAVVRADAVQPDLLAQQPQQLAEVLPEDRPALELAAIQRAIQAGEVRPPETPIPDLPSDSGVDLLKVQRDLADNTITDDVVQALDDELALREQFKQIDEVIAQETEKAARDAVGYDLLTFDEKKTAGVVEGFVDPPPTRQRFSFPADIAKSAPRYGMATVEFTSDIDRAAYMLRDASKKSKGEDRLVAALEQAGFDVQAVRAHGEKVKQVLKSIVTQQTGSAAAPQKAMKLQVPDQGFGSAAQPAATPPAAIDIPAGASRKITARTDEGRIEVAAESLMSWTADAGGQPMSIDQARNLVRQKGAILDPDAIPGLDMATAREDKTKGVRNTPATDAVAAAYRQFYGVGGGLRATRQSFGPGAGIPARLVDEWLFEKPDGWAAASVQQLMATKKPAQFTKRESLLVDFAAEVRDRGGEQRFRQAWLDQIEKGVNRNAAAAESVDLDGWLSTYSERTAKSLASSATSELMDAMKEGIRVSGINPERMKVLDQIVTMDQFGPDEAYQATKAWDPVQARLIDQRPYSDAARYIDSRTAGLRVPAQHPSPLQDSILLSLELQLSKTFGRGRSLQRRGRSMVGDAYHEAFHRLQEFLFSSERAALETPQAKEEMVALIKKGNGTYQPDMDIAEIQAEAFAVWALRRYEVRSRGTAVQRIFSAISEVVNAVGAVARIKLKKNPTVIDIFEDAWGGGIGDRSDRVLQKLGNADLLRAAADVDETLARLRPDIAQRVQAEIDRRYAQVEAALDDWNNRNREGGC